MKAYFDASVLVSIAVEDGGWQHLRSWMDHVSPEAQLSDFGWGEVASAIATRVRDRKMSAESALEVLAALAESLEPWSRHLSLPADIQRAVEFMIRFHVAVRLPDAIHIAIAERTGATLITTDRQRHRAALALGIASINPLQDGTPP